METANTDRADYKCKMTDVYLNTVLCVYRDCATNFENPFPQSQKWESNYARPTRSMSNVSEGCAPIGPCSSNDDVGTSYVMS